MTSRITVLVSCVIAVTLSAQAPVAVTQRLAPSEQKVFEPGYAIGDVSIADPKVADFRVLGPNRRGVMIIAKAVGTTNLILWDQQSRRRHEVAITVTRSETDTIETQLRALLADFPSVEIRRLGAGLVIAGSVSSKDDLQAIDRIATAARVNNVVRFVPPNPLAVPQPEGTALPPAGTTTAPPSAPRPAGPVTPSGASPPAAPPIRATNDPPLPSSGGLGPPPAPGSPPLPANRVVYEIELLEASSRFRTGSYGTGIEPSGRRLYKGTLVADTGVENLVFIGGKSLLGAPGTTKGQPRAATSGPSREVETGIRLYVTPQPPDARGRFTSRVMVETNLPLASDLYDPETWRRARFEFAAQTGEPFAITGGDLLANPDSAGGGGSVLDTATRTSSRVASLPGVPDVPGLSAVPVFGSLFGSRNYRTKQTQLLVILRPTLRPRTAQ